MIHQFDHRWATYDGEDSRDTAAAEKIDPGFEPTPHYWVPEREVTNRLAEKGWARGWLMGWRNISRASDERSLISSVFPKAAAGHSLPLILPDVEAVRAACLVGNLCSLVADYCERQKLVGTNITFQFLFQIPVLPPSFYTPADLASAGLDLDRGLLRPGPLAPLHRSFGRCSRDRFGERFTDRRPRRCDLPVSHGQRAACRGRSRLLACAAGGPPPENGGRAPRSTSSKNRLYPTVRENASSTKRTHTGALA